MKRWFIPSQPSEPGEEARVRLVHLMTLVSAPAFLLGAGAAVVFEYTPVRAVQNLVLAGLLAIAFVLNRRKHHETAAWLLLLSLSGGVVAAQLLTPEGSRAVAPVFLPLV